MRPGDPWGDPPDPSAPVVDVHGDDGDLARAAVEHPGALLRFDPAPWSDLARALGITSGRPAGERTTVVACDLLAGDDVVASNAVVLGVPPDRLRAWHRRRPVTVTVDGRPVGAGPATTVVVASGQFLRGTDLVPRGHPGDGRAEVQVYGLEPAERRPMRARLAGGDHVPHPRIGAARGRRIEIAWGRGEHPVEWDGLPGRPRGTLILEVRPGAARVLI